MTLMQSINLPILAPSAPALQLLQAVGFGRTNLTLGEARRIAGSPKPTVDRHLRELVAAHLLWRVRRDLYVTPRRATFALLAVEPSSYLRSLLLFGDGLDQLFAASGAAWAFACLGVHQALDLVIPHALPVLRPAAKPPWLPDPWPDAAFLHAFQDTDVTTHTLHLPSGSKDDDRLARRIPVLRPEAALALLAASTDPRIVQATRSAAARLGIEPHAVLARARELSPQEPPVHALRPNTVVFPSWLARFASTARKLHALHYLESQGRPAAVKALDPTAEA